MKWYGVLGHPTLVCAVPWVGGQGTECGLDPGFGYESGLGVALVSGLLRRQRASAESAATAARCAMVGAETFMFWLSASTAAPRCGGTTSQPSRQLRGSGSE